MIETPNILPERWFPLPKNVLEHPEQTRLKYDLLNRHETGDWHFTVVAGRRSFKTERFSKRLVVDYAIKNDNHKCFLTAPTRAQVKEIFWEDVKKLTPKYMVKGKPKETDLKIELINGTTIHCVGMDSFERIEGGFAHVVAMSEYQETDPEAYLSIQPMIVDVGGFIIKEGRPIGRNHLHTDYMRGVDKEKGYKSYHWKSSEILSEAQILIAKNDFGEDDYKREYDASFDSGSNMPYYAYSELNHNSEFQYTPRLPLIITCDFNATEKPMSWVAGQRLIQGVYDVTYWLKCFSHTFTNTETMCGVLKDWISTLDGLPTAIYFYGDYAGNQTKSNSSKTDWDIIESHFRNFRGYQKYVRPCLSIRDSIGATNAQLCNSMKHRKQFVNPIECKALITDWNKAEWKDNGRELKDKDALRGHLCRAVDYYNYYEHPITGKKDFKIIQN